MRRHDRNMLIVIGISALCGLGLTSLLVHQGQEGDVFEVEMVVETPEAPREGLLIKTDPSFRMFRLRLGYDFTHQPKLTLKANQPKLTLKANHRAIGQLVKPSPRFRLKPTIRLQPFG